MGKVNYISEYNHLRAALGICSAKGSQFTPYLPRKALDCSLYIINVPPKSKEVSFPIRSIFEW